MQVVGAYRWEKFLHACTHPCMHESAKVQSCMMHAMYDCKDAHMYVGMNVRMYVCMYVCMSVCVCVSICLCVYVCMHVCVHVSA